MSNLDRKGGSWYAPLERPRTEKKKRRPKSTWLWIGLPVLVLLLIVGTSLAFAGTGSTSPGAMPSDWSDYLENFYQSSQSDTLETSIERTVLEQPFTLPLAQPGEQELSLQELYAACADSIVGITAYPEDQDGYYWGTGVIADASGLIVTNAHVIVGGTECYVVLISGESYEAKLVGFDEEKDLAVIKVDGHGLPAAQFGDSDALTVGDTVYAIGNPLGVNLRGTLTDGIVSAINRDVYVDGVTMTLIQTNAALNNGNSGGPLINMYGQVIGINTMKMGSSTTTSVEGLGCAIPIASAAYMINDLIAYGEIHGEVVIGISVNIAPVVAADGGTALEVYEVVKDGPGDQAGILAGDYVIAADGERLTSSNDLIRIRRRHEAGETLRLEMERGGERYVAEVVLRESET